MGSWEKTEKVFCKGIEVGFPAGMTQLERKQMWEDQHQEGAGVVLAGMVTGCFKCQMGSGEWRWARGGPGEHRGWGPWSGWMCDITWGSRESIRLKQCPITQRRLVRTSWNVQPSWKPHTEGLHPIKLSLSAQPFSNACTEQASSRAINLHSPLLGSRSQ